MQNNIIILHGFLNAHGNVLHVAFLEIAFDSKTSMHLFINLLKQAYSRRHGFKKMFWNSTSTTSVVFWKKKTAQSILNSGKISYKCDLSISPL